MTDSLDSLWAEVSAPRREPAKRLLDAESAARAMYSDSFNWTHTRNVALIHEETQTCLGVFEEHVHKRVASCRRLVRNDTPSATTSSYEYVTGPHWISVATEPPKPRSVEHARVSVIADLFLEGLGVSAESVLVTLCTFAGGIERAELAIDTSFHASGTVLSLPVGTNVWPLLSRNSKISLNKELHNAD